MKYSLGTVLYYWEKNRLLDFYDKASASDFDTVYLGETVCVKRRQLSLGDWLDLAKMLKNTGKDAVLSTMVLLESKSDLNQVKILCDNGDIKIEANDLSAVNFLCENKVPFVAGASLNIYNQHALHLLYKQGMQRWVMPVELSRQWLQKLTAEVSELGFKEYIETEVYGYGHLPLAYSARCFTARSEGLPKDACKKICLNYPNGKRLCSQEGQELFVVNGIQTMTGSCCNLIQDIPDMTGLVDVLRLSPENEDIFEILGSFKSRDCRGFDSNIHSNGYWRALPGMMAED